MVDSQSRAREELYRANAEKAIAEGRHLDALRWQHFAMRQQERNRGK